MRMAEVYCGLLLAALAGVASADFGGGESAAAAAVVRNSPPSDSSERIDVTATAAERAARIARAAFTPAPRSIDGLRRRLGEVGEPPGDDVCAEKRAAYQSIAASYASYMTVSRRGQNTHYGLAGAADSMIDRGLYVSAEALLRDGIGNLALDWQKGRTRKSAALYARIGHISALRGDLSGMNNALGAARANMIASGQQIGRPLFQINRFEALSKAEAAQWSGDLFSAETHYREAREWGRRASGARNLYAQAIARNLMLQGRLAEADHEARFHATSTLILDGKSSSRTAKAITVLGEVLYEQGRIDDAEYLARVAVNVHENACAFPDSLSLALSRALYARTLAVRGDWPAVAALYSNMAEGLRADPDAFARLAGADPYWTISLIETGRIAEAEQRIAAVRPALLGRVGADGYEMAELDALAAMARYRAGDVAGAMVAAPAAVERLIARSGGGLPTGKRARNRVLEWVLASYIDLVGSSPTGTSPALLDRLFIAAETARSRDVDAALANASARARIDDPVLAGLVAEVQLASERVASLVARLAVLESAPPEEIDVNRNTAVRRDIVATQTQIVALSTRIGKEFPRFARIFDPSAASLAEVQAVLRPGEALVATFTSPTRTYVFGVTRTGVPSMHAVEVGADALARRVDRIRESVTPQGDSLDDVPAFALEEAHALYRELFGPLEQTWQGDTHLIVAPHGALARLPLGVLVTRPPPAGDASGAPFSEYRGVEWLGRLRAISTLPSASSLVALRAGGAVSRPKQPFAGFGDPIFSPALQSAPAAGQRPGTLRGVLSIVRRSVPDTRFARSAALADLPPLPETAEEVGAIARALGADSRKDVFLRERASESVVKSADLSDRRVLLFATHGLVPGDIDGLVEPALALSAPRGKETDDGLLTMTEILGLSVNADWVVLSACNTGAARGAGAEAVSGLGQAFFYAGARSLLITHWPIETTSARALTTATFETERLGANVSRAEALRRARIKLIDEGGVEGADGNLAFSYAHPLFWAPFALVGDGG